MSAMMSAHMPTLTRGRVKGQGSRVIHRIDAVGIRGLGPAVAHLLYFTHPTLVVPFNTAIVKGYNTLTRSNVKLGRRNHDLALRERAPRMNAAHPRIVVPCPGRHCWPDVRCQQRALPGP